MRNSLLQALSLHGPGWTLLPANPSFLALLFLLLPKTCTFRTTTKYILALLSYSPRPKQRPSPYPTERGVQHSIPAPTARDLQLSLSPDGNDQNLCLSSPKKEHNQQTSNSAAFSAKSLKCQTLYSECFMKNFARRCFNALCYKYSEAILCKWIKPVNTLIAKDEMHYERWSGNFYVLDLEFLLFLVYGYKV